MDIAKIGPVEKGTRVDNGFDFFKEKPLDLSIQSRNQPFCGKSFYLDLPHNKGSQILSEAIKKLGGVIESFLSKEVAYVVSGSNEARPNDVTEQWADQKSSFATASWINKAVKPTASTKPVCANSAIHTGLVEQRRPKVGNHPKHISRGKELLHKAILKKDVSTSILANARNWGVHILHVNEILDYLETLTAVAKTLPTMTKVEAVSSTKGKTRKVAQLKSPFLKIEDQSRQFRPLHFHFQSFPLLNMLAARGCSLFELTSPRGSYKDQPTKAKTVDAECYLTHSETEERSPKGKPTVAAKKRRKGYCECCQEAFEELTTHLHSEQHHLFALDNSQYALVDHIISQFPNDFIVQAPDVSNSRFSAPNNVSFTSLKRTVPQLAEAKVFPDGLDTARNTLKADDEEWLVCDILKSKVTDVKSKDDRRMIFTTSAKRSTKPIQSSLPARDLYCSMERSDGKKEMSLRALLETGERHAGKEAKNTRDEIISRSNGNCTSRLLDAHQYGKDNIALCNSGLAASAVLKRVAVLQADSAMLKLKNGELQEGCKGPTASTSEHSSARKRKRRGQQCCQGLKRRAVASVACYSEPVRPSCPQRPTGPKIQPVAQGCCSSDPMSTPSRQSSQATKIQMLVPSGCFSDPVSPPHQLILQKTKWQSVVSDICTSGPVSPSHNIGADYLAFLVGTKSSHIPTDTKGSLQCSMQNLVAQRRMVLPSAPCISAAPHSVEVNHTLPGALLHNEKLQSHWDCFSPSVYTPSGVNESRDNWDFNTLIPRVDKCEKELNLFCNIVSPTLNQISSTCCKHPTEDLFGLQKCIKHEECKSAQSAFHMCSSGCSVSLLFQDSTKHINQEGEANLSCLQIAHALTSSITDGTSLQAVEMFSSASDWDVPLLSRLDSLHAIKTTPLNVDVVRRTSVSMQDTGYESHLCSVLKPKSEFDWSFKEEGNHVICWAEAESVPFTVLGTCLSGWAG